MIHMLVISLIGTRFLDASTVAYCSTLHQSHQILHQATQCLFSLMCTFIDVYGCEPLIAGVLTAEADGSRGSVVQTLYTFCEEFVLKIQSSPKQVFQRTTNMQQIQQQRYKFCMKYGICYDTVITSNTLINAMPFKDYVLIMLAP